jgi:hypothetical protein
MSFMTALFFDAMMLAVSFLSSPSCLVSIVALFRFARVLSVARADGGLHCENMPYGPFIPTFGLSGFSAA